MLRQEMKLKEIIFLNVFLCLEQLQNHENMSHVLDKLIGKRFRIVGNHPHTGCFGKIVRIEKTSIGKRPIMKFDEPHLGVTECYIANAKNVAKIIGGKPKK